MAEQSDHCTISLQEFTNTYLLFGGLLVTALMAAELAPSMTQSRTDYCLWVAIALFIPALAFFVLAGSSDKRRNYWRLFWTFSFLAYFVHLCYSIFGLGLLNIVSLLLGIWWLVDLLFVWVIRSIPSIWGVLRIALLAVLVMWFAWQAFAYSGDAALIPTILGITLLATVFISLTDRQSWQEIIEARV